MNNTKKDHDDRYMLDYLEREDRINKTIVLEKPDRVPVVTIADSFIIKQSGLTEQEAMYDYQKFVEVWLDSAIKLDFDMAPSLAPRMSSHLLAPHPAFRPLSLK